MKKREGNSSKDKDEKPHKSKEDAFPFNPEKAENLKKQLRQGIPSSDEGEPTTAEETSSRKDKATKKEDAKSTGRRQSKRKDTGTEEVKEFWKFKNRDRSKERDKRPETKTSTEKNKSAMEEEGEPSEGKKKPSGKDLSTKKRSSDQIFPHIDSKDIIVDEGLTRDQKTKRPSTGPEGNMNKAVNGVSAEEKLTRQQDKQKDKATKEESQKSKNKDQFKEKDTKKEKISSKEKDEESTKKSKSKETEPGTEDKLTKEENVKSKNKTPSKTNTDPSKDKGEIAHTSKQDAFPFSPERAAKLKKQLRFGIPSSDEEGSTTGDTTSSKKDIATRKEDAKSTDKSQSKEKGTGKDYKKFWKFKNWGRSKEKDKKPEIKSSKEKNKSVTEEEIESSERKKKPTGLDLLIKRRSSDQILPNVDSKDIIIDEGLTRDLKTKEISAGEEGFVNKVLDDVLEEEEAPKVARSASSSRRRTLADRRQTIAAAGTDLRMHFETALELYSNPRKRKDRRTTCFRIAPVVPVDENDVVNKTDQYLAERRLRSEWSPSEEPTIGYHQRIQSWVGSFVVGTDYWGDDKETAPVDERVKFSMDNQRRAWYDLPISDEEEEREITPEERALLTRERIESVKVKKPQDADTVLTKDRAKRFQKDELPEKLMNDLKEMFHVHSQTDDLAGLHKRLSLSSLDKWLEKVNLLDHKNVTVVHTGFFFKSAGGARYRGLSFEEFVTFMEMVAEIKEMPLRDTVHRLKHYLTGIDFREKKGCFF